MQHEEFRIGATFWCGGQRWRCTDIGRRAIVAIRLDRVSVESSSPERRRRLGQAEAEAEGWFKGPPYAVLEHVFDEEGIEACTLAASSDSATSDEADTPRPELPRLRPEPDHGGDRALEHRLSRSRRAAAAGAGRAGSG